MRAHRHAAQARATRGGPERAKRVDLGRREIEPESRGSLEEAFALGPLGTIEVQIRQGVGMVRHHPESGDAGIIGDELPGGQVLAELLQGSEHEDGETDGEFALAMLGHRIRDDVTPDEMAALLGGDLQDVEHAGAPRHLGGPRHAEDQHERDHDERGGAPEVPARHSGWRARRPQTPG